MATLDDYSAFKRSANDIHYAENSSSTSSPSRSAPPRPSARRPKSPFSQTESSKKGSRTHLEKSKGYLKSFDRHVAAGQRLQSDAEDIVFDQAMEGRIHLKQSLSAAKSAITGRIPSPFGQGDEDSRISRSTMAKIAVDSAGTAMLHGSAAAHVAILSVPVTTGYKLYKAARAAPDLVAGVGCRAMHTITSCTQPSSQDNQEGCSGGDCRKVAEVVDPRVGESCGGLRRSFFRSNNRREAATPSRSSRVHDQDSRSHDLDAQNDRKGRQE